MNNQAPDPSQGYNPQEYDPLGGISSSDELKNILIGFMGQTYSEVSKFDKHLVSPNVTLRPKTQEFQNIAEKVLSEAGAVYGDRGTNPQRHNTNPQRQPPVLNIVNPVVEVNQNPQIQPNYIDPNQMEFSFDESATAISIQRKLEDIMLKLCTIQDKIDKLNPKPSEY